MSMRMNCAPKGASGTHRSATTNELTQRTIEFERRLMEAMGIHEHDAHRAGTWVAHYAERLRGLLDTDAALLALVHAEEYGAAIARVLPLLVE